MPLVYSCIMPHGGEIIARLASKVMRPKFEQTRRAMEVLGRRIRKSRPDTIVIASPHNLRIWKRIAIVTAEYSSGTLNGFAKSSVSLRARCDRDFAWRLIRDSDAAHVPVAGANYGTSEGPTSEMQMDWGTLVPLWFALRGENPRTRIAIVGPSREIPIRMNYKFGQVLGKAMSKKDKRFVFIASADQGHAHSRTGPYGFSPAAAIYDRLVSSYIKSNDLRKIMSFNPGLIERAKPDSLWQMTMLAGVTDVVPSGSRLLSYQVPTYYGMTCAEFEPARSVSR